MSSPNTLNRREAIRRGICGAAGLTAGALTGGLTPSAMAQAQRRPNVILMYTDDQNFDQIGCYGYKRYTPNQDSIAHEGVRFNRGYVTTSVCTPSRYGCLTGQFAGRCSNPQFTRAFPEGVQVEVSFNTRITPGQPNIANVMKQAGYTTGMVGKWDQGGGENLRQLPRGDAWTKVDGEADLHDPKITEILRYNHDRYREAIQSCGFDYAESIYFGNPESFNNHQLNIHNLEWVVKGALDFIDQNRDKPFFLYFAPTLHHIPHPQESLVQSDPRITAAGYLDKAPDVMPTRKDVIKRVTAAGYRPETAFCTWMDDGIGVLLKKLDDLKLTENTLILFVSDNATIAKGTLFEGGIRIPFMAQWKGKIRGGQVTESLVQNIDLAPTIFDACGVQKPAAMEIDGASLMPLLLGRKKTIHDELFFEIGWTHAVCTDRWKYTALRYSKEAQEEAKKTGKRFYHNRALEPHQHKVLLEHPNFWDPDQLYDLSIDEDEVVNLAYDPEYSQTLGDMKGRLKRWLATFGNHPFGEFTG
ncbi:sulfatase-like hydrolase/transferase [bacterium]|nr:sulfatase-like hydrolase/transferase [bacterium]